MAQNLLCSRPVVADRPTAKGNFSLFSGHEIARPSHKRSGGGVWFYDPAVMVRALPVLDFLIFRTREDQTPALWFLGEI